MIKQIEKRAADLLVDRTIVEVRYMNADERDAHDWLQSAIVLVLDNGMCVYPSIDDEGNGAGSLFTTDLNLHTIPSIYRA